MCILLTAVHDRKSGGYFAFNTARTRVDAERSFITAIRNGGTPLSEFPEDFALVALGTFNEHSGKLVPFELIEVIIEASSVVTGENK